VESVDAAGDQPDWNELRQAGDKTAARRFKDARIIIRMTVEGLSYLLGGGGTPPLLPPME